MSTYPDAEWEVVPLKTFHSEVNVLHGIKIGQEETELNWILFSLGLVKYLCDLMTDE